MTARIAYPASALIICGAILCFVSRVSADAPATQPTTQAAADKPVNTRCPVTGDPIDPKITYVYAGKTYAFCCADCVDKFKKDPAKYAADAK
jgi:YHS domain-containing protein